KHLKVETIEKAVKNLKDFGIEPKLNILFGASPLETEATIRYTIKKTIELKPGVVMFNIANPFPGTEFYEDAKKNGWFVFGDYVPVDVQKESIISYPHLPKKRLEYLTKLANFKYYANPKLLWSHLRRFHDPIALWKSFKSFLKKFRGFKV
ncbi:MAG: radical SAM protein, partial [Candidatus Hydrothermota bacterium]